MSFTLSTHVRRIIYILKALRRRIRKQEKGKTSVRKNQKKTLNETLITITSVIPPLFALRYVDTVQRDIDDQRENASF